MEEKKRKFNAFRFVRLSFVDTFAAHPSILLSNQLTLCPSLAAFSYLTIKVKSWSPLTFSPQSQYRSGLSYTTIVIFWALLTLGVHVFLSTLRKMRQVSRTDVKMKRKTNKQKHPRRDVIKTHKRKERNINDSRPNT